jgi:hypothetical protein
MHRIALATLLAVATVGGYVAAADAADQLVPGKRLVIFNRVPDQEHRNRLTVLGKSGSLAIEPPGSAGDPTCDGAGGGGGRITFTSMTSGESHTTELPCQNWTGRKTGSWRYNDVKMLDGTCKRVEIRSTRTVRALCYGRGPTVLDFDLRQGEPQDPIDVVLELGTTPERYCMTFGGLIARDGSDAKNFMARNSPAPAACPDAP